MRRQSVTNYTINVVGAVLPLFVAVVTLPIYVRTVGDARFGVLSILWLLLGYAGFLDLGLSRATENALAKAEPNERESILVTATVFNVGLGLLGSFLLFVGGSYLLQHIVSVPHPLRLEINSAMPWIAALFPLALVAGTAGGALESRERFLVANIIGVTGNTLGQVVPVIFAIVVSPSLEVVVPAAVLARVATILALFSAVYWQERPLRLSRFHLPTARRLFGYGSWVTVSSIVGPVLVSLDQLVIGSRLGVASLTYYAVPMSLVSRGLIFAGAMSRTLFPGLSRLDATVAREMAARATTILALFSAALFAPAILIAPSILSAWMGPDFALKAGPVAQILLVGAWINGLAFVPHAFLQARGRPDLTAKLHLAEIVPFVGVLWFATSYYGLVGAAAAWTARVAIDAALMITAARFSRAEALRLVLPAFCVLSSYIIATRMHLESVSAWIAALCIGLLLVAILVADASTRRIILRLVGRERSQSELASP